MTKDGKEIKTGNKTVAMVEYQGRCDASGCAVGHAPKVLTEYFSLISDWREIRVYAPEVILQQMPAEVKRHAKVLKHCIVMKESNSLHEKIRNKFYMFSNIRAALYRAPESTLWFFNIEYYFLLYLALFGNHGRDIVCTMFIDGYHNGRMGRLKQKVFELAQKRIRLILATGPDFTYRNARSVFVPDYLYEGAKYAQYRLKADTDADGKKRLAVCLGTMGKEKKLEEMAKAFTKCGYPLLIAGRFYDEERVRRLKEMSGDNVEVRNEYLSREEYLSILSSARYTVLPYPRENYATQTSGVLQEAVFLDTIPVTYKEILDGNRIPGVGIGDFEELPEVLAENKETAVRNRQLREQYKNLRKEVYDAEKVRETYRKVFG